MIEYSDAAETFARSIDEIGIERVARLGKVLSGIALIGTSRAIGYQQQFAVGQFYVCTHSNTQTKKRVLEEIAADLGVQIRVVVMSDSRSATQPGDWSACDTVAPGGGALRTPGRDRILLMAPAPSVPGG